MKRLFKSLKHALNGFRAAYVFDKNIRLEITHTNPEKSAEALAVKLAEAFNNAALFDRQAVDFKQQAQDERRKAQGIQVIISNLTQWRNQLEEDRKNGIERKISRMEPMLSYDPDALEKELVKNKKDAKTYTEMSDDFTSKAKKSRQDIVNLQVEISKINAQINNK